MTDKFIDKARLNTDRATNATGLLSAIGAVSGAIDGISHGRPVGVWLPMVFVGLSGAISQWLQGSPSQGTKLISSILHLEEGRTNAELLRNIFGRIIDSGVVPGVGGGDLVDSVDPQNDRRRSDALASMPEWSQGGIPTRLDIRGPAVDPAARVARYWQGRPSDLPVVGSPTIDGTNISGVGFAARSMAMASDDPPSEAW